MRWLILFLLGATSTIKDRFMIVLRVFNKSNTHSVLKTPNQFRYTICTSENPVERGLIGVSDDDLEDYAQFARRLMRSDPDIVLIRKNRVD